MKTPLQHVNTMPLEQHRHAHITMTDPKRARPHLLWHLPRPWTGRLISVFVTAKIPIEIINAFLESCHTANQDLQLADLIGLQLVTSIDGPTHEDYKPLPSYAPVGEDVRPLDLFENKSVDDIGLLFEQQWKRSGTKVADLKFLERRMKSYEDGDPGAVLPTRCFVVLDEETLLNNMALLVTTKQPRATKTRDTDGASKGKDYSYTASREEFADVFPTLLELEFGKRKLGSSRGLIEFDENGFGQGHDNYGRDVGGFFEEGCGDYSWGENGYQFWDETYGFEEVDENGFQDWHPNFGCDEETIWLPKQLRARRFRQWEAQYRVEADDDKGNQAL